MLLLLAFVAFACFVCIPFIVLAGRLLNRMFGR